MRNMANVAETVSDITMIDYLNQQLPNRLRKIHLILKELYPSANFKDELREMEEEEQHINGELAATIKEIKQAKEEADGLEDLGHESDSDDDVDEIDKLLNEANQELKDKERELKEAKKRQKEEKSC